MAAVRVMMPGEFASGQGGSVMGAGGVGSNSLGSSVRQQLEGPSSSASAHDRSMAGADMVGRKVPRKLDGDLIRGMPGGAQVNGGGGGVGKRQRCSGPGSSSGVPIGDEDVSPQEYLHRILYERGYETDLMPASHQSFFHPPNSKQVEDYDLTLVGAVKRGDIDVLRQLASTGRCMDACNKHGESIVHISCRRGHADILRFLLDHGARVDICDDLGRTPLHDACWAKDPVFECVTAILRKDLRLLRVADCRGASPLAYVKKDHWAAWRQFFDRVKEEFWAYRGGSNSSTGGKGGAATGRDGRAIRVGPHSVCETDVADMKKPVA